MTLPKGYVKPNKEAEERSKREAEEKFTSIPVEPTIVKQEGEQKRVTPPSINTFDYYLMWEQLRNAYLQTMKEATSSYFRLLDFWSQYKNQKE